MYRTNEMGRATLTRSAGLLATLTALGCGPPTLQEPNLAEVGGQPAAEARISTTSPLIVEWPAAERGRLETRMRKGLVAVNYRGASLELLPDCNPGGHYAFAPMVPKSEHLVFASAADLDASFPLGAARLGTQLEAGHQLELTTRLVGRWELAKGADPTGGSISGCARATHLVSAATVGAFRLYSGSQLHGGIDARTESGVGIEAQAGRERKILNSDGRPDRCSSSTAAGPPEDCGALIRLELSPFDNPRPDLIAELGTLDFTPIEKRIYLDGGSGAFNPLPFPGGLCLATRDRAHRVATRKTVNAYCQQGSTVAAGPFPPEALYKQIFQLFGDSEEAPSQEGHLLWIDATIRRNNGASPSIIQELEREADSHPASTTLGYHARYLLAGSGDPDTEERNLRELIGTPRLSRLPWPRMRLAKLMASRDRSQAVVLAMQARALTDRCSNEHLEVLDWLATEGSGILSEGELFDLQLDAVTALAAQGQLPSVARLGEKALFSHDYETWNAAREQLTPYPWALGALYWAEGVECDFRGNLDCAEANWRKVLIKAPDSPYVVPAYQALLRVVGKTAPEQLASMSRLRPETHAGSQTRDNIARGPSCGALTDEAVQQALDDAARLAVTSNRVHANAAVAWEVDSLSAIAPDLSSCAIAHPSNGKQRLLNLRIGKPQVKSRVQVAPGDGSQETQTLATCVEREVRGNSSLFAKSFSLTIRVAPEARISFDHDQGWTSHVRDRFDCSAGDGPACLRLGTAWLDGKALPREPAQALAIFGAKCAEGILAACVEEAVLRRADPTLGANKTKAQSLLTRACAGGRGRACRLLAEEELERSNKDLLKLRRLLHDGCQEDAGDATSCVLLWYARADGILPPDETQSSRALLTACRILGHGAVEGDCSTPAELMAAYPHQADADLGRLTCKRGIWQGCEAAIVAASDSERESWAEAGCKAGSPDSCAWLATESLHRKTSKREALLARATKLCKMKDARRRGSVCEDMDELSAQREALKWQKQRESAKQRGDKAKGKPSKEESQHPAQ